MEFFIKKNATLPLLKMQVVKDGRSDYNKMFDTIEDSAIFFSMIDVDTGIPRINTRPAGFVNKVFLEPNAEPEYYIYYQFSGTDTKKEGRYEGQFLLRNDDGVLILPIREKLYINIQESFVADSLAYDSCYVLEFPCCTDISPSTTTTTLPPVGTVGFSLYASYVPGSVNINYVLSASESVPYNYTLEFTNILGTITGDSISITTGVTMNTNSRLSQTQVTLPFDFDNLNGVVDFDGVTVQTFETPINFTFDAIPTFPPTTTTTTTMQPITDALLVDNNTYFDIGNNLYIKYVE